MWFVGALLGLVIGSVAGDAAMAFACAVVGAFIGGVIGSSRKKKKQAWRADQTEPAPNQIEQSWGRQDQADPRHRINQLEQRVEQLEFQLAELQEILQHKSEVSTRIKVEKSVDRATTAGRDTQISADDVAKDKLNQVTEPMPEPVAEQVHIPAVDLDITAPEFLSQAPVYAAQHSAGDEAKLVLSAQNTDEVQSQLSATATQAIETAEQVAPVTPAIAEPPVATVSWRERLPAPLAAVIFGGNWLVKSGVAILFLGLAFLLRYTSEYISIPVEFRYLGVAASAVAATVLGWRLRTKNTNFALAMQGLGIGSFYLTALFALKLHHLIDHLPCFVFLFAMSVLAAALAVLQKAPSLAIIASLAGFATPVLSGSGENNPFGLFTYLAILDLGIAIIAWFQAWRMLNLIGFVGTFALAAAWADRYYSDASYAIAQAYLILFGLLYALIGLFYARATLREVSGSEGILASVKRVGRVDSALVFGLPMTAFAIQYVLVKDYYLGSALAAVGFALFYMVLARLVYARQLPGLGLLAEAYLIVAGIFVTLSIPLALENSWTGAAWAVEGAGMYWLGVRQQRAYARALAFIVLLGAWSKLSFALSFNETAQATVLTGSWIGPLLLLFSCVTVWRLFSSNLQNAEVQTNDAISASFQRYFSRFEAKLSLASLWLAWIALVSLHWVLFDSRVAAVVEALAGAVLIRYADKKISCKDFHWPGIALQVLAVLQFAITLQLNPQDGALFASGWQGIVASCFIALALLSNIVLNIVRHRQQCLADGSLLVWSKAFNAGILVASLLVQFSLLFALSLNQAAIYWSLSAALFIALALYLANFVLALGSGALLLTSVVIYVFSNRVYEPTATAFFNQQFAAPLCLSLALLFVAERIYQAAKKGPWTWPLAQVGSARLHNGWCHYWQWQALPLLPGLWFWFSCFSVEPGLWLAQRELGHYWGSAQLVCALMSAGLLFALAKVRQWTWATYAQFIYLPWLIWLLDSLAIRARYQEIPFIPISGLDYVIWGLTLISHFVLLCKAQLRLPGQGYFMQASHALGCYFFVLLFSLQLHALALLATGIENAWTATAWVVMPLIGIALIVTTKFQTRWPWNEWREFYLTKAAIPLLVFCWMWFIHAALTQDGSARPLPFFSILNPLELAQVICLLLTPMWWRALPELWQRSLLQLRAHYAYALAGLLYYTTVVLRACSQYAAIPYEIDSLFDAKLAQASVSVAWALAAVISMMLANRRQHRSLWIGGAVLLAVVVLKLFVIELADHGGLYRIISFIVVGLLLLVVGYFAPYPGSNLKQNTNAGSES